MTVKEIAAQFGLTLAAGSEGIENRVSDVYIGDLLSWVMGNAPQDCAWITIQGHINIIAVALLANVSCIIIAENSRPDPETLEKAEKEGLPVLTSSMTSYQIAARFAEKLSSESC